MASPVNTKRDVPVVLLLASVIGLSLGMLGGGGSTLTVPILSYVAGMRPEQAIAASLFVVAVTSGVSVLVHARAGRVDWRIGGLLGAAGVIGSYTGGRAASLVPGGILMIVFAIVMLASAVAMLQPRTGPRSRPLRVVPMIAIGIGVGALSGFIGAGGGFLVVPVLVIFGGLAIHNAVATSLLVIALQSMAGFGGHIAMVDLEWKLTILVTGAAVLGSILGGVIAPRMPASVLRRGFAALVILMAAFVLVRELAL
jgi:uncharacterized protein